MQPAITVKNLSKTFRLPGERRGTLRERPYEISSVQ